MLKVSLSDRIQRNWKIIAFFIVLNGTVVSKITVTLVNRQKIQQLRMFISVGKQTTRTEWIHLHKHKINEESTHWHLLTTTCLKTRYKKSSNMTRLVKKKKVTKLRFINRTECTSGANTINVTQFWLKTTWKLKKKPCEIQTSALHKKQHLGQPSCTRNIFSNEKLAIIHPIIVPHTSVYVK